MYIEIEIKISYNALYCWYKKIPGYLNKLPGISSTQNITKIVAYLGTEYSNLLTLLTSC